MGKFMFTNKFYLRNENTPTPARVVKFPIAILCYDNMDFPIPFIFIALFLLACCSLFLVYKYGMKGKSYEEALAEQRKTTNTLLGARPKPKEKKSKKGSEKVKLFASSLSLKEKQSSQENETDESENVDAVSVEHPMQKPHVEFKEELEEVPIKEVVHTKLKRVKKVRPILVKKDKSPEKVILDVVETPIVNHFEENPPKDDFELLRSNSRDDVSKQEPVKEKVVKEKKPSTESSPQVKSNKKLPKQQLANNPQVTEVPLVVEKETEEKVVETVTVVPQINGVVGNAGKEKRKKRATPNRYVSGKSYRICYLNVYLFISSAAEREGIINLVRKAEFSNSEIQLLIDLLLNKQLEAPQVLDDWSEGKSDPVQKLKKQLAEKEKALTEEQEALLGAQARLKEVRAEQQAERSQLQQKIRALEEVIQNKHIEHQAINNRLQVNTQKIQQLQAELNAEILKTHKLMEDNTALQMQTQQIEVRLSEAQEVDNIIVKLRSDIEELSAQNQHLRLELQQSLGEKEHQQQQFMIQMSNLEKGLKQQIQQLEESHRDLERSLDMALRQENEWKIEISNLNTALQQHFEENRRLEHTVNQLKEELQLLNNEKTDNIKLITQLKSELQQLKDEQVVQVNGSSEANKAQEVEILNLTNELSSVKNELSSISIQLQQTETKYKSELENSHRNCSKIQAELEEQKKKNNELRTKNWKVMEALNVAESRSKAANANKQTDVNLDKITTEVLAKERDSQKEFIQRLFPEIEDLHVITSDDWQTEFGKSIRNYISNLKEKSAPSSMNTSQSVEKLQAQLQHYKTIIDDTDGMLTKLETHVKQEEIKWRRQLQAKNIEIDNLKENRLLPLEKKILSLEKQLSEEIRQKEQVYEECRLLKSHQPRQTDSTATIEKLSEEVNRLREQLRVEQSKNGDVNICLKAQNNSTNNVNSTNGPALIEVPSIRNANICSNMGCQFLYCDGNSCQGN
ncbi:hypothetical protein NQ315_009477 [Exocentrus adspersus]|uniref:Kinectin n=1 Tax=Exocentrus adspersus TaxID=1586481 RepID=A0AAV8WH26_9CUCU|nr:hypothetical protein NQ315_009477 [Exocentrus adspersus]